LVGVGFILSEYLGMMKHGGVLEFIEIIFILGGGYTLIYLILSSFSFLSNHYNSKQYLKDLEKNITNSETYIDFCMNMSKIDRRYIMHIQRISKKEQ